MVKDEAGCLLGKSEKVENCCRNSRLVVDEDDLMLVI